MAVSLHAAVRNLWEIVRRGEFGVAEREEMATILEFIHARLHYHLREILEDM